MRDLALHEAIATLSFLLDLNSRVTPNRVSHSMVRFGHTGLGSATAHSSPRSAKPPEYEQRPARRPSCRRAMSIP